ncbi:MAG: efflux RND transporter permease subunit [Lentimicrobiaceae bacterium]|nr:efflux RND transporter permease subunit [Lentimicrobiaceae bacterium]
MKKNKFKEFFATSWAIDSKTSIYVIAIFITILGLFSYQSLPKESFPEIVIPTMLVTTPYPGTSPEDMENLVTRPVEKELKALNDVKKITSSSVQDFSTIAVEFNTGITKADAKQRVKDAVDKAIPNLPNDLPSQPNVMEIDLSEIPIMYINISGNYDLARLKKFAEEAQDRIEQLPEITRVDIVGALEREIQINVDMYKMQAAGVTLGDLENAIAYENVTVSAGNVPVDGMKRSLRVRGQFTDPKQIENIVLLSTSGAVIYVKDVAQVLDSFKEQESFARFNKENVITLNVVKKSGKNLLNASDEIKNIINNDLKNKVFPSDLKVSVTGDQSRYTRSTLEELNNTIIIGFLLVTVILMFFMGFGNAFFVGLSVPLSIFVAYMVMPGIGFTMNMMVMFSFIFALGIIVDDAIVVIENTHRLHRYETDIVKAAKHAAGEVFLPIFSGTLTTLAPFFPLAFWPGIVGKFMYFMPVTVIITLFASLFVAYIINPVFAVSFMKHEYDENVGKVDKKKIFVRVVIFISIGLLFHLFRWTGMGNFMFFVSLLILLYFYLLKNWVSAFQNQIWPYFMKIYERTIRYFMKGRRPYHLLWTIVGLFFLSFIVLGIRSPKILFFPDNQPNEVYIYIKLPVGTDQKVTDSITMEVENRIFKVLGEKNPLVESVISNVAIGASSNMFGGTNAQSNLGKVTVNFVEHKYRHGANTTEVLEKIRKEIQGIPGAEIVVEKEKNGPPTGKPINIEVTSENLENLIKEANRYKNYLDSLQVPGVERLKSDFEEFKPEIVINIDRERANHEGISTGQIAMEVRSAVFGKEISKYKENEDEYEINIRYAKEQRENINRLLDLKITYRDMNSGQMRQIPLSSVARIDYSNTYGGINRKDLKRMITLSSEVLSGFSANEVMANIKQLTKNYEKSDDVTISFTGGEQEEQNETSAFLGKAMLVAIGLIFFILISQFNSISKAFIILSEVLFSIIGVFFGIAIFNMPVSILMTGLGIVALGGIVVRNGILLVEFTDVLKEKGMKTRQAIVEAGKTRITPVVLTATACITGLIPLAVGFNINFVTLFTELKPDIYFGGDNVSFWSPLCWTIIFGVSFATFLTLVFVPAMYFIVYVMKIRIKRRKSNRSYRNRLRLQKG